MKVIIAGGRHFNDWELLKSKCDFYLKNQKNIVVISGGAKGADALGERYASENRFPVEVFSADWKKHGSYAGPIRNNEMALAADCLIAFWNGKSPGTKNMITLAKIHNLKVRIVNY